jgi:hypothetical protein
LSFTFVIKGNGEIRTERDHLWDRGTDNYVLTFLKPDSNLKYEVFFNTNSRKDMTYKNGIAVSEEENKKHLERAYQAFINDSYWLLIPAKLEDPGVNLQLEKQMSLGRRETILHVSFEGIGLTPGDPYWLFVDDSGRIVRWKYLLQSGRKGEFIWENVKDCGACLRFLTRKRSTYGSIIIEFQNVKFSRDVDMDEFRPDFN